MDSRLDNVFINVSNQSHVGSYVCSEEHLSSISSFVFAVYFICIIVGGIIFNIMLLHTIWYNSDLHSIKNYFIINMAICDFLRSIGTLPFEPDMLLRDCKFVHGKVLCGLKEMIFFISLPASIINLLILTIERLLILIYPFQYRKYITKQNVFILLTSVWVYVILVATFPFLTNPNAIVTDNGHCFVDFSMSYGYYQVSVDFALPLLCIFVINMCIFKLTHRAIQRRANLLHQKTFFLMNLKAAKTIMVILLNVAVCWMTYIVIIAVNFSLGPTNCYSASATYFGKAINSTSAATNPVLYGLLNTSIRKLLRQGLVKRRSRRTQLSLIEMDGMAHRRTMGSKKVSNKESSAKSGV